MQASAAADEKKNAHITFLNVRDGFWEEKRMCVELESMYPAENSNSRQKFDDCTPTQTLHLEKDLKTKEKPKEKPSPFMFDIDEIGEWKISERATSSLIPCPPPVWAISAILKISCCARYLKVASYSLHNYTCLSWHSERITRFRFSSMLSSASSSCLNFIVPWYSRLPKTRLCRMQHALTIVSISSMLWRRNLL